LSPGYNDDGLLRIGKRRGQLPLFAFPRQTLFELFSLGGTHNINAATSIAANKLGSNRLAAGISQETLCFFNLQKWFNSSATSNHRTTDSVSTIATPESVSRTRECDAFETKRVIPVLHLQRTTASSKDEEVCRWKSITIRSKHKAGSSSFWFQNNSHQARDRLSRRFNMTLRTTCSLPAGAQLSLVLPRNQL
jgi:hypothetical protein